MKVHFSGDYAEWDDALKASTGYQAPEILLKVKEASLKVKRGEAAFERDSVAFEKPEVSWLLLSGLLWTASRCGNSLNIVDFGGSLGSTYYQYRAFLSHLTGIRWNVVEQPHFVACGREFFQDTSLKFFESLDDARLAGPAEVILCSSSLQYVTDPYGLAEKFGEFRFTLIDRTPFIGGSRDRLTVQDVSPLIYKARYPAWFLSKEKFLSHMARKHRLVADFPGTDSANIPCEYLGMIFERKS